MASHSARTPLITRFNLDSLPSHRSSDDPLAPSSRRERCSLTIPEQTSLTEEEMSSVHSSYRREDSKAVAGAMRALQTRVRGLEEENHRLKDTIDELERKAEKDRTSWKQRMMEEVGYSKNREMELISKFQKLDLKLKAEAKRIKQAETAYKDSEADLLVKLEQANADKSALEMRLQKMESEYSAVLAEKEELEQRCEAQQVEIQAMRDHFSADCEKVSAREVDPPAFSPTFEDLDTVEMPSHPAPGNSNNFIEEIRREIQEARDFANRPRSNSPAVPDLNRAVTERRQSTSDMRRSSSLHTFKYDRSTDRYSRSYMDYSRLVSLPNSPIVFNPVKNGRTDGPRVSFHITGKPVIPRVSGKAS